MAPSEAVSKALEKAAKRAAQAAADDTLGLTSENPDSAKNHGIEKKLQEAKDKSRPFSMDIYIGGFYYCHRMYSLHLKHPTKKTNCDQNTNHRIFCGLLLFMIAHHPVTPSGRQAAF